MRLRDLAVSLAVLAACGCGGGTATGTTGTTGGRSTHAHPTGTCLERQHLTPAELAQSPRGARDIEALAANLDGAVAADPTVFARLVRDIGAIQAAEPSLTTITYRTGHDDRTLMLEFGGVGGLPGVPEQILAGQNPAFEALRARFQPTAVNSMSGWVVVAFERVYDFIRLRDYYRRIPGVTDVGLNVLTGDGPSMCVDRESDDAWAYWVLDAGGDCPAGCTTLRIVGMRVRRDGTIERLGESSSEAGGARLTPVAETALNRCRERAAARMARPTEICAASD